jgi:VanZ family protein
MRSLDYTSGDGYWQRVSGGLDFGRGYTRAPMSPRYWLPPVLWIAVIFAASSDPFSTSHSAPWLATVLEAILGHPLPPSRFEVVHFVVRKLAHLTEYGILSALLFRAMRADAERLWNLRWAVGATIVAAIVAALDEWHQVYVPSRTGAISDVGIDILGALLAQVLIRSGQLLLPREKVPRSGG